PCAGRPRRGSPRSTPRDLRAAGPDLGRDASAYRHSALHTPALPSARPRTMFFAHLVIRVGFPEAMAETVFAVRASRYRSETSPRLLTPAPPQRTPQHRPPALRGRARRPR